MGGEGVPVVAQGPYSENLPEVSGCELRQAGAAAHDGHLPRVVLQKCEELGVSAWDYLRAAARGRCYRPRERREVPAPAAPVQRRPHEAPEPRVDGAVAWQDAGHPRLLREQALHDCGHAWLWPSRDRPLQ